jgi:hypothetical protein
MRTPTVDRQSESFEQWLAKDPPPDPQMLAEKHGGWSKVPPEQWRRYDRAMAAWRERYRKRHL